MQPRRATHRRLALIALAVYLLLAALIAFWPTPVDGPLGPKLAQLINKLHNHGMPLWLGYDQVQFGANILFFIPLTFLLTLLLGRHRWGFAALIGLVGSICIEFIQGQFLTGRFSSAEDVAANTIGALAGALLARWLVGRPND